MNKFIFTVALFSLFFSNQLMAAPISLIIPESTLAQTAQKLIPLEIKTGKSLAGKIYITEITDLQLKDKRVSCKLGLEGKDMQVVTKIAGTKLNLAIGNVATTLNTDLELIYNKSREEIILTPHISDVAKDSGKAEVAGMLLSLLDGHKFPIALKDIPPIIAESGGNNIFINLDIVDIEVQENQIYALIEPLVSKKSLPTKE